MMTDGQKTDIILDELINGTNIRAQILRIIYWYVISFISYYLLQIYSYVFIDWDSVETAHFVLKTEAMFHIFVTRGR